MKVWMSKIHSLLWQPLPPQSLMATTINTIDEGAEEIIKIEEEEEVEVQIINHLTSINFHNFCQTSPMQRLLVPDQEG